MRYFFALKPPSLLLLLFLGGLWLSAGLAPAADPGLTNNAFHYASEAQARAAWQPMTGTPPVSLAAVEGEMALRLPCRFAGSTAERASWDHRLSLDLSASRGLEFQVFCRNAAPVSYFSLYLESGAGWYHASFYPEVSNGWNTITLDKTAFRPEGKPAGWSQIRTLRVSAWRGQPSDTEFLLRHLRLTGALGQDALIALVRAESLSQSQPAEARSAAQFTETTAGLLRAVGLGSAVLSDLDLTLPHLAGAQVVILPHNPGLPKPAVAVLEQYVQQGGKLLVCYSVPEGLHRVLGVSPGRHVRETRPGYFAAIHALDQALPGAPPRVGQASWNIQAVQPIAGTSRVLAEWLDDQGKPNGYPAIIGSSNGLVMTHVLLSDDAPRKARLLLAMVGQLAPELWRRAAQTSLDQVGQVGGAKTFAQAETLLAPLVRTNARAGAALASARAARDQARDLSARGNFAAGMDQAASAQALLLDAWCLAQSPLPKEFRAFWCHSAFGLPGRSWDAALERLATNGFTAILPNMLWGGAAYYPSQVLPVAKEVAQRGDQIAQCVAAAHRRGLQVHVWKVNWNLGHAVPPSFVETMRRAGRLQASSRGQEEPWLCPSHPDNQKLEMDAMLEVARNYEVDGLHFDYIRFPDRDHCFCAGCRERFQRAAPAPLADWPRAVLTNGPLRQAWLEWRRAQVTAVVRAVAEQAHALKPGLKISAAVFRNWPSDRDEVGQDWKLWCERGWLDFVCPMDYTASARQFENMVARQVEWAGSTPCYPGIGESASSSRLGVDGVIEQIQIARRYRTGGFVIFNYGVPEADELLPRLGLGITARPPLRP